MVSYVTTDKYRYWRLRVVGSNGVVEGARTA